MLLRLFSSFFQLGGLSGQESAKRAIWYGIVGMALAVFATLIGPGSGLWLLSLLLIAGGGSIGYNTWPTARADDRDATAGGGDALAGWSGGCVSSAFNAHFEIGNVARSWRLQPRRGGPKKGFAKLIAKKDSVRAGILRVELFLGIFIGAITFTGSVIAYGKLAGKVTSAATKLPGGHMLNASAAGCR